MKRETLNSRLGFILLSAGCAIGLGNVWSFPWRVGQSGGGAFVLVYILFAVLLGVPVMAAEFTTGRATRRSIAGIFSKLEKPGQKWHIMGYAGLIGNVVLMMFYTTIAGYFIYYLIKFISGDYQALNYGTTASDPVVNVVFMMIVVVLGFIVLSFNIQNGLEKITKYMMVALFLLMIVLAVRSCTLPGAKEGLEFYLKPDFSKIDGNTIIAAMNQSFFSLSLGIGSMAIFGSYINKERALLGEAINVVALDTLVALLAGFIIFPSCTTYGIDVSSGPPLLFTTMVAAFSNMPGGQIWGSLFFLFMIFAAMSTVFAVFENIVACTREITGWERKKACGILCVIMIVLCLPMAFDNSLLSGFDPFGEGSGFLDLWLFILEKIIQPAGSIVFLLICTGKRWGWGWDKFVEEANTGKGAKIMPWMRAYTTYVAPVIIAFVLVYGIVTSF